ncbi:AAA family ATPase [Bradyrhizobium sp. USDA 223]|uniref:AAA family ATPase n=1 Tax=Bradyrhizobium sp. USDA 223 TaxID=3156306 RepID=UPI003835C6BE
MHLDRDGRSSVSGRRHNYRIQVQGPRDKLPGEPRDVLLIAREGSKGFGERIDAFKAHHSITADPDRLVFMRSPTNLGDPAQFEELKAAIAASGRRFKVVAVDTVGRALPGEDFYDAKSITGFMERLQQLGEIGQGVAVGVHHVNKSGDAFGSVYFGASSDFMFLVEREGDGQLVRGKITCAKMKDGEDGWKRRVDYGKAASSLVVASVTEGGDMMGKALKLSDDDRLALQALGEALRARGQLRPEFPGRSVTLSEWLDQCFKIGGVSPDAAKPMRDLHRRQVKLLANRMILVQDQLVRIIDQTASASVAIPMAALAGQFPPIPPRQT